MTNPAQPISVMNSSSKKTLKCSNASLELKMLRDSKGIFLSPLIKNYQTPIASMDRPILALYSKGMTNSEIALLFKKTHDADVSASLTNKSSDLKCH